MPSIAIGTSDDNRSARRLRIAGVLIPLISTRWAESFMAAFLGDDAWNCETFRESKDDMEILGVE
jgi:hypothetical protein